MPKDHQTSKLVSSSLLVRWLTIVYYNQSFSERRTALKSLKCKNSSVLPFRFRPIITNLIALRAWKRVYQLIVKLTHQQMLKLTLLGQLVRAWSTSRKWTFRRSRTPMRSESPKQTTICSNTNHRKMHQKTRRRSRSFFRTISTSTLQMRFWITFWTTSKVWRPNS